MTTVEDTNGNGIKVSPSVYNKRTVAPKTTPIPVPPKFKLDEKIEYPGGNYDSSLHLFYITAMAVEGNDGVNSKLVIKHRPTKTDASEMVIPLNGHGWDEFEKPDLERQFDNNFLLAVQYTEEQERKLLALRQELITHVYDYFHNNEVGKSIMEYVRKRSEIQQQKLDAADAAHYDKVVRETAEHIMAKYHIATIWETGDMLYFKDGKHVLGAERIIDEEAFALFQYDARTYMIEEVKKAIRRQTYHDLTEFDADLNIQNVKNGLYHVKEKILTPHTPDYLSLDQKDVTYVPGAKCPRFEQFLTDVNYPSQVKTTKQSCAYTFYRDTPHEIYVILVGFGWNGKTILTKVMTRLHGRENVSHVPLNDINKDLFALSGLERKDLNIDNEPSGGLIKNSAILKKLTGQEYIRVQEKYIKAHEAKLHAKIWVSTNDVPDIPDESIGRFRREIAIMFPYTFKPNPDPDNPMEKLEDPEIEDKLTTEEELSGIFNMLMDELHDILYKQNKRVYIDMQDIEARKKHREMLKRPIEFFVDEVIDLPYSMYDDYVRKDDLFKIYEQFCRINNLNPTNKEDFGRSLVKVIGKDKIKDGRDTNKDPVTKKRPTIWKGIKVKPEWLDEDKRLRQTSIFERAADDDEEREQGEENQSYKEQIPMSGMSEINGQNDLSVQENVVIYDDNSRSNIACDTTPSPVLEPKKPENDVSSLTIPDMSDKPRNIFYEIMDKAMLNEQGNNKGYFTKDDWTVRLLFLPDEKWTEDQAEQTLLALIEDGEVTEIEEGRFRPKI
jgi:P4 family phage/plasmid primase-like protien